MSVLGIDIGVTGGLAVLDQFGDLIDLLEMPCLHDGPKKRRTINAPLLASFVYKSHATRAFVEQVGPRPLEGVVGIAPGKDGAKDAARAKAISLWPHMADQFKHKNDDGLAEAALIAFAGLEKFDIKIAGRDDKTWLRALERRNAPDAAISARGDLSAAGPEADDGAA